MNRLTTDAPKNNLENALNFFYVKDHEAYVRGGGPAPDYKDVSLNDYMKRIIEAYNLDIPTSAEDLPDAMYERLFDGTETMEGLMATLYTAAWAFAEIRHRLSEYEDTGLSPEEVVKMQGEIKTAYDGHGDPYMLEATGSEAKHIIDLMVAEATGCLVVLPCSIESPVYLIHQEEGQKRKPKSYRVDECDIDHFTIGETMIPMITAVSKDNEWHELIDGTQEGYEYFLTQEAAEAALAKDTNVPTKTKEDNHE